MSIGAVLSRASTAAASWEVSVPQSLGLLPAQTMGVFSIDPGIPPADW